MLQLGLGAWIPAPWSESPRPIMRVFCHRIIEQVNILDLGTKSSDPVDARIGQWQRFREIV